MRAKKPTIIVIYNGNDVSKDLSPLINSLSYTDNVTGKADTIDLTFADTSHLWQTTWRPVKGDKISVSIGFDNVVSCGEFEIDETEFTTPPDLFTVRAISAAIKKDLRTARSIAYENQTLKKIVLSVAARHNLNLIGTIEDFVIKRETQNRLSDLSFLAKLAETYGYVFSVRSDSIIFENVFALEEKSAVDTFGRDKIVSFRAVDKVSKVFKSSRARSHDPKTGKFISASNESSDSGSEDVLEVWTRSETDRQSEVIAAAALHKYNSFKVEGDLDLDGSPFVLAGNNIEIIEIGYFSGVYHVVSSTHTINENGYTTSAQVKKIGEVTASKQKPKTQVVK